MTLEKLKSEWNDTPEYHQHIKDLFTDLVNKDNELRGHRDWVEHNVFGFGERAFWWAWKLICEELPHDAKLIEIGVFKGATLSLWQTIPCLPGNIVYGISPMNGVGTGWTDDDYRSHIIHIHHHFKQEMPIIFEGLSEDEEVIKIATRVALYHVVYIDGGHERHHIDNDLKYYAPLVMAGGFLVIDDACCDMHMPFGFFQGIQPVTDGVLAYMHENGDKWEFMFNVVHLRIYRRK